MGEFEDFAPLFSEYCIVKQYCNLASHLILVGKFKEVRCLRSTTWPFSTLFKTPIRLVKGQGFEVPSSFRFSEFIDRKWLPKMSKKRKLLSEYQELWMQAFKMSNSLSLKIQRCRNYIRFIKIICRWNFAIMFIELLKKMSSPSIKSKKSAFADSATKVHPDHCWDWRRLLLITEDTFDQSIGRDIKLMLAAGFERRGQVTNATTILEDLTEHLTEVQHGLFVRGP